MFAWTRGWLVFVAVLACAVIAFLTLRTSPYVGELPFIPSWLGVWADSHGNLRNLPAFFLLTLFLVPALGRLHAGLLAAILSITLELAQLLRPGRTFDWADICWSLVGVVLAVAGVWGAVKWKRRRISSPSA